MSKRKVKKASEILNESYYPLARKVSHIEAYPTINTATASIQESGKDVMNKFVELIDSKIGQFYDCSNKKCHDGGVNLGRIIREMERAKQTEYQDTLDCRGTEGVPTGRREVYPCENEFAVSVQVQYK